MTIQWRNISALWTAKPPVASPAAAPVGDSPPSYGRDTLVRGRPLPVGAAGKLAAWNGTIEQARALDPTDTLGKLDVLIQGLVKSGALWRNVPPHSEPGGPHFRGDPYELDALRTPAQIMAQGVGGECGSCGKILADALIKSGVSPDDVYLVDTVGESVRAEATQMAKKPGMENRANGSGHNFVLVRDAKTDSWQLVNTTASKLEALPFEPPQALLARMGRSDYAGQAVHVRPATPLADGKPAFPSLLMHAERAPNGALVQVGPPPEIFGDLVVYSVQRSVDYRNHRFADRVQAIAAVVPKT